jgi:hypothetical protein
MSTAPAAWVVTVADGLVVPDAFCCSLMDGNGVAMVVVVFVVVPVE